MFVRANLFRDADDAVKAPSEIPEIAGSQTAFPHQPEATKRHLGHGLLMDISDPESENVGKYWTGEQVEEFSSLHEDTITSIRTLLQNSGVGPGRFEFLLRRV